MKQRNSLLWGILKLIILISIIYIFWELFDFKCLWPCIEECIKWDGLRETIR